MALSIFGMIVALLILVAIVWRIALYLLKQNPTLQVKMFFWVMSALFIVFAGAAFVTTRFIK